MKKLTVDHVCVFIKVSERENSNLPLQVQAEPYFPLSPIMIIDMEDINLSSMLIGELVNLATKFESNWEPQKSIVALVNITAISKNILETVKLVERIPIYESLEKAIQDTTRRVAA